MAEEFMRALVSEEQKEMGLQPLPGAPIRSETSPPAMFIGLGGTGALMTAHIARRLAAIFANGDVAGLPESLQFLILDTDPSVKRHVADLSSVRVPVIVVNNFPVEQALANRLHAADADYPHPYQAGSVTDGAHQVRAVGHVAMVWAVSDLWPQLQAAFQRFQQQIGDLSPRVYILSSMCGGTGAGMAFDVAYLAKALIGEQSLPTIIGVFLDPGAFEGRGVGGDTPRMAKVNAYAFLKELDHFFASTDYPLHHFENPELRTIRVDQLERPRPFWITYIVGTRDNRGRRLRYGREHVCGLVGEFVVTQYLGWQKAQVAGAQDLLSNLDNQVPDVLEDGSRAVLGSLGVSAYVYPRRHVENYALFTLGARVLERFLSGAGTFDPKKTAADFMTTASLEEHQQDLLTDKLRREGADERIERLLQAAVDTIMADRLEEVPGRLGAWQEDLRKALEARDNALDQAGDTILGQAREAFHQWCSNVIAVEHGGVQGLIAALEELRGRLDICVSEMEKEMGDYTVTLQGLDNDSPGEPGEIQRAKGEVERLAQSRRFGGLLGPERGRVRQAVEGFVQACQDAARIRLERKAREVAAKVHRALRERVEGLLGAARQLQAMIAAKCRKAEDLAIRELRFGAQADGDNGGFTQHLHYALTGDDVRKLFGDWYGQRAQGEDPVAIVATETQRRVGSLWEWFVLPPQGTEYTVASRDEKLMPALSAVAGEALEDLRRRGLADVVDRDALIARAGEMARDCSELCMLNPALMSAEANQWHSIFLAVPGTGELWERVRDTVQQAAQGAEVQLIETGDPDRIILARCRLGIPVKALREIGVWYQLYWEQLEQFRREASHAGRGRRVLTKPPHICKDWEQFEDPIIEAQRVEAADLLGLGLVTRLPEGYRIKGASDARDRTLVWPTPQHVGGWFYLHECPHEPDDRDVEALTLGQGLANAADKLKSDRRAIEAINGWFFEDSPHCVLRQGYPVVAQQMNEGLQMLRSWRDGLDRGNADYEEKLDLLERMIRAVENYIRQKLGGVVS
jgi:hypothetical protein